LKSSKQEVTIRWKDGTSSTSTLKPSDPTLEKECNVTAVVVRELVNDKSVIRCLDPR
jgi:hypothetical protein